MGPLLSYIFFMKERLAKYTFLESSQTVEFQVVQADIGIFACL